MRAGPALAGADGPGHAAGGPRAPSEILRTRRRVSGGRAQQEERPQGRDGGREGPAAAHRVPEGRSPTKTEASAPGAPAREAKA